MANINITSDAWTEISITSGTIQNISATADIELSAEQTDNSGVVLKPSEIYQWDNETIYARAVTESAGALRVVNFKKAAGGGGYVLPVASSSTLGGVKVGNNLSIDESGVLSAPVLYSTTEKVIGTWIDGKPLYQITIQDTMPTITTEGTRTTKVIDIASLSIKFCASISGGLFDANQYESVPINSVNNISQDIGRFAEVYRSNNSNTSADALFIATSRMNDSEKPIYVTLQYTKTTD